MQTKREDTKQPHRVLRCLDPKTKYVANDKCLFSGSEVGLARMVLIVFGALVALAALVLMAAFLIKRRQRGSRHLGENTPLLD